jgi:hypothetical protein
MILTFVTALLVLALAAPVLAPIYADMSITEPGCPAARGLDL